MIYKNITELIGNTPILHASRYAKETKAGCDIYLKLECFNPAGSIKDRVAKSMIACPNIIGTGFLFL